MFTLELDLIITYTPPMSDNGGGIHLTRELQLPFPPYTDLRICSGRMDQAPGPMGFILKDVVWDIDREVFMAHCEMNSLDLPMENIPADLKAWIDLGWRIGSYNDRYDNEDEEGEEQTETLDDDDAPFGTDPEFERQLERPMLPPRERSKRLNLVMRALVRTMVEVHNDESVAYAMDKTKRHFTEHQLEHNDSVHAKQWCNARNEYLEMGWKKQCDWQDRIMRTHPRLDKLVKRS